MVNINGISYDNRMTEDTGASVTDVARAWVAVREVLDFPTWWEEISELTDVALDDQLELFLDCRRTAERCSLWFLRHRRPPVDIAGEAARFREPLLALETSLADCLHGPMRDAVEVDEAMVRRRECPRVWRHARRCGACCTRRSTWSNSPNGSG